MDRTNKYMSNMHSSVNTSEYRDYFAELVAAIMRVLRGEVFCTVFTAVTFIASILFVIGVMGGIEMNTISYVAGIPLLAMMACVLALLHKLRK